MQREGYKSGSEDHFCLLHNDIFGKRGGAGPSPGSVLPPGPGYLVWQCLQGCLTWKICDQKRGKSKNICCLSTIAPRITQKVVANQLYSKMTLNIRAPHRWDVQTCDPLEQCLRLFLELDAKHFKDQSSRLPTVVSVDPAGLCTSLCCLCTAGERIQRLSGRCAHKLAPWHLSDRPIFPACQTFLLVGEIKDISPEI